MKEHTPQAFSIKKKDIVTLAEQKAVIKKVMSGKEPQETIDKLGIRFVAPL
jgi:hypothetical protein